MDQEIKPTTPQPTNTTGQTRPGDGSLSDRARTRRAARMNSRKRGGPNGGRNNKRKREVEDSDLETRVISVRRVTRVVKGGKRMRFSALVVAGDLNGKVGIGIGKGSDYQDAVTKATKKAKSSMIKVNINDDSSIDFTSKTKHKAALIYLKPAKKGTGIIAGGFLRPVVELAGIKNVYSKIIGTRNKIAGTQAAFKALGNYSITTK
jgi:small subunit ribosomal protein S5